ncbi:ATP-dependent DNA helicase Rep, partial [Francisella tularensis subsp. holarctica]|nr:ATP-dependent DNA helicase Rep [Francisella tularensis subsp. holarctica]
EVGSATVHKLGEYASQHHCSFVHTLYSLENFELRDFTKRNLISFKDLILNTQQQINTSISVQELINIINSFIDNISYRQGLIDSSSSEKQAEFRYAN